MRVAALYDIHGNLPALEAVLHEVSSAAVDCIVVGGDVIPGPFPRETIARVRDLDVPVQFIHGNGDREVLALLHGKGNDALPAPVRELLRWTAEELDADHARFLAEWPATVQVEVDRLGEVLFCHATPRNDTDIFTRLTPDERVAPLFEGSGVRTVVCGHTHMQFDRAVGGVRVVNAGSVGMPFGEPGAYWLLLGPEIELRRTDYDLAAAAVRIRGSGYPKAEDFAANHVLAPPSEREMLERLTPAG